MDAALGARTFVGFALVLILVSVHAASSKRVNEHGPAERLTAPGSRVGFAERDAS